MSNRLVVLQLDSDDLWKYGPLFSYNSRLDRGGRSHRTLGDSVVGEGRPYHCLSRAHLLLGLSPCRLAFCEDQVCGSLCVSDYASAGL